MKEIKPLSLRDVSGGPPGSPVVRTPRFYPGAQVGSQVRELISWKPQGIDIKKEEEEIYLCCLFLHRFIRTLSFNCRIIALQCCTGFYRTTVWISHKHTCVPRLLSLPPNPPYPTPLSCQRAPGELPVLTATSYSYLARIWPCACFSVTLWMHPFFPLWVHKSVLSVCVSTPPLQTGSSVPFF